MRAQLRFSTFAFAAACSVLPLAIHAQSPAPDSPESVEFFEKKIRPILVDHCYNCHSADTKPSGGLRVDDRNGLLMGGDAGPAIVAGDPDNSLLLERIVHATGKKRMPKEGKLLTEAEIADLTTWIKNGVAWPREKIPPSLGRPKPFYNDLKAHHWAWQPLTDPEAPKIANASWPSDDLDRFILAKLEAKSLAPVADADSSTLIRRVTYDLTGLPPTPEEIDAFTNDTAPDAFARVVDRLLASPAFGERWGRHWLDVARYGESTGPSRNIPYPFAWKYRDYVLDAFNKDIPYDRFIQEQIAGDLLPADTKEERDRLLTATGFLALGVKDVNQRFKIRFIMDNVDEQIDAVSRSVLGLTVSCARCHDHKFDPIPATDYYSLAGIFTSTDDCAGLRNKMGGGGMDYYDPKMLVTLSSDAPPPPAEQIAKLEAEVAAAKKAWDEIRGTPEGLKPGPDGKPTQRPFRLKYEQLQADFQNLADPAARGLAVHGVRDSKTVADTEVRIRGEAERIGPTEPRGFLSVFEVPGAPKIKPNESGRLELSQWLTSPKNPLTPRVIVNRIWQNLFGQGIVSTVDNFGVKGDVPSNPELLDHLASEFIRDGWSTKKLVRTIVLSRAYRLASEGSAANQEIDPGNRLVWRHSPRRLEAEEIRDAMLASAGKLQPKPESGSAVRTLKMREMRDNGPEAKSINEEADNALFRSVYLPLLRGVTPKSLEAFDPAQQTLVTGKREATTVPTQALYMLNSPFVRKQSLALAERLLSKPAQTGEEPIRQVYKLALSRSPNELEIDRAKNFLAAYESSWSDSKLVAAPVKPAREENSEAKASPPVPVNPDDIDRTPEIPKEDSVQPKNAKEAAWMSFVQAIYASAEFRFVR
jgi:Protein of unknown function (DUF1553)/Protein of unknown function (DUF1549)/Planctomycete cytochrome C